MLNKIKKYIPFFKGGAMSTLAYKFVIITWMFITALQIAFIFFLWIGIYKNSPQGMDSVINGYSFKDMITYLVFMNIFQFSVYSSETSWTIHKDIKEGTIANNLIKPISYRLRFIASTLGGNFVVLLMIGIPALSIAYFVFYLIGFIKVASVGAFFIQLGLFIIALIMSVLLLDTVNYITGICSFYTTAVWGLNCIKDIIVAFLSGQFIPIAFFPAGFREVVQYSPFVGITQNPVLILLGKYDVNQSIHCIGLVIVWFIVLEAFAKLLFVHASKRITVQGG